MQIQAYDEAGEIAAVEGEVVVLGPGQTAMSMTPDAAEEAARRLINAAIAARSQVAEEPT